MQFLANQQNSMPMTFVYLMYGGLILFFLYKQYTGMQEKKKIQGQTIKTFKKEVSKLTYILGALIIAFGIFNIVNHQYISGVLMIALVLVLLLDTRDTTIATDMGLYGQGKYLPWNQIKKWAFDLNTSELVLTYKDEMQDKSHYVKVEKTKIEELNSIIRRFKLGKQK